MDIFRTQLDCVRIFFDNIAIDVLERRKNVQFKKPDALGLRRKMAFDRFNNDYCFNRDVRAGLYELDARAEDRVQPQRHRARRQESLPVRNQCQPSEFAGERFSWS